MARCRLDETSTVLALMALAIAADALLDKGASAVYG